MIQASNEENRLNIIVFPLTLTLTLHTKWLPWLPSYNDKTHTGETVGYKPIQTLFPRKKLNIPLLIFDAGLGWDFDPYFYPWEKVGLRKISSCLKRELLC